MTVPRETRNQSQSLRRALALLDHVRLHATDGISLTAIADDLGMDKSTVLRLSAPLLEEGLLAREPDGGLFRLGLGSLRLGQAYLASLDLRTAATAPLRRLRRDTGHTCHLVVYDKGDVVYIDKLESAGATQMASRIGSRMPASSTAVGRCILAHLDEEETAWVLAGELHASTAFTLTDPAAIRAQLAVIRDRGYAVDDRENEAEVRCVGAPVFDHRNRIAGAISVSALLSRLPAEDVPSIGPKVAATAREISLNLGAGS